MTGLQVFSLTVCSAFSRSHFCPVARYFKLFLWYEIVTQCKINSVCCLTLRKGMMLSLAIAWRSRGAPVSDCRPAPTVEKKEPMTITHGDGQERVPTTNVFLTASPNLQVQADWISDFYDEVFWCLFFHCYVLLFTKKCFDSRNNWQ